MLTVVIESLSFQISFYPIHNGQRVSTQLSSLYQNSKDISRQDEIYSIFSKPPYLFFREISCYSNILVLSKELGVISRVREDSSIDYYFSRMTNNVATTRQSFFTFLQKRLRIHNHFESSMSQKAKTDLLTAQDQHQRMVRFLHSERDRGNLLNRRERRMRKRKIFLLSTWLEDILPDPSQGKSWMVNMAIDSMKIALRCSQLLLSFTKVVPKPKVLEDLEWDTQRQQ